MTSKCIPGFLLAQAILFCVLTEHRGFCENSCIFFHPAITILFSKEFLYLFFNTLMQNLSTYIFHFHVCVVNMLTPVCSVLPGQRLCLLLPCTKCKHNRHLSLNECYHCTEHWGYLGSFCPYQAHRLIKELAASEWLQGKEIIILGNNIRVWTRAKSLSMEKSRNCPMSYEVSQWESVRFFANSSFSFNFQILPFLEAYKYKLPHYLLSVLREFTTAQAMATPLVHDGARKVAREEKGIHWAASVLGPFQWLLKYKEVISLLCHLLSM